MVFFRILRDIWRNMMDETEVDDDARVVRYTLFALGISIPCALALPWTNSPYQEMLLIIILVFMLPLVALLLGMIAISMLSTIIRVTRRFKK